MSEETALESSAPEASTEQSAPTLEEIAAQFDAENAGEAAPSTEVVTEVQPAAEERGPDPIEVLTAKIAELEAKLVKTVEEKPEAPPEDERLTVLNKYLADVPKQLQTEVETREQALQKFNEAHMKATYLRGKLEAADEVDKPSIKNDLLEAESTRQAYEAAWHRANGQIQNLQISENLAKVQRDQLAATIKSETARQTQEQAEAEQAAAEANHTLTTTVESLCSAVKASPMQTRLVEAYVRSNIAASVRTTGKELTPATVLSLTKHFAEESIAGLGLKAVRAQQRLEVAPQRNPVPAGSKPQPVVKDAAYWKKRANFINNHGS